MNYKKIILGTALIIPVSYTISKLLVASRGCFTFGGESTLILYPLILSIIFDSLKGVFGGTEND